MLKFLSFRRALRVEKSLFRSVEGLLQTERDRRVSEAKQRGRSSVALGLKSLSGNRQIFVVHGFSRAVT